MVFYSSFIPHPSSFNVSDHPPRTARIASARARRWPCSSAWPWRARFWSLSAGRPATTRASGQCAGGACLFGYGLLAGVLLLTPAFPATSLVREKIKGTLAAAVNSPIRPWSIYLGKVGGVLGFAADPAGDDAARCGGLLRSRRNKRARRRPPPVRRPRRRGRADLHARTAGQQPRPFHRRRPPRHLRSRAGRVAVPLIPYALLRGGSDPLTQLASLAPLPVAHPRRHGSPGTGRRRLVRHLRRRRGRRAIRGPGAGRQCRLRRGDGGATQPQAPRPARPAGVMTEDRSLWQRVTRRFIYLVDPQRRSGGMSLWVNPVMVKEFRSRRFGRSHWTLRLIAFSADPVAGRQRGGDDRRPRLGRRGHRRRTWCCSRSPC